MSIVKQSGVRDGAELGASESDGMKDGSMETLGALDTDGVPEGTLLADGT